MSSRLEDVLGKMKAFKEQIKQMSDDQTQMGDLLRSIAEKQVSI